jgi:multidrug transporter EmrE-like cation transporter
MSQPLTTLTTRPRAVLVIVSLGLVLSNLDLFVVNVALPSIAEDLHPANLGELSWILNAYAIVFAALLVPAGRLADRTSRRAGFLLGVAIFVIASAACAASTSVPLLIAFRVLQAIGAAMLLPTSLGLVLDAYPPQKRFGAVRVWAARGYPRPSHRGPASRPVLAVGIPDQRAGRPLRDHRRLAAPAAQRKPAWPLPRHTQRGVLCALNLHSSRQAGHPASGFVWRAYDRSAVARRCSPAMRVSRPAANRSWRLSSQTCSPSVAKVGKRPWGSDRKNS